MRAPLFLAFALLAATHPLMVRAETDYSANVKQPFVTSAGIKRVAILPVACPDNIECDDLEKRFAESMHDATGIEFVPSGEVRSVMQGAQITSLNYETRYILAESLSVNAFATLEVRQAAVEKGETTYMKMGVAKLPQESAAVKHVQLALQMLASDGKVLLESTGEAHLTNSMRSLTGIAERGCARMIEESVPKKD
jgi:hypothetical protein